MGFWKLSLIPWFWVACFYSKYGQEGTNNKYSQLPETFYCLGADPFFSWMTFIFPFFNCFVCITLFLRAVSKYHFREPLCSQHWQNCRDFKLSFSPISSHLIDLLAYLAAMIPGTIQMLIEEKLGLAEKQTKTIPYQNSGLISHQISHTLCNQTTYDGEECSWEKWEREKTASWTWLASYGMRPSRKKYQLVITNTYFLLTETQEWIWSCRGVLWGLWNKGILQIHISVYGCVCVCVRACVCLHVLSLE